MICPNCRFSLPDDSKFCSYCGTAFSASPSVSAPQAKPVRSAHSTGRTVLNIILAVLSLTFIGSGIYQCSSYSSLLAENRMKTEELNSALQELSDMQERTETSFAKYKKCRALAKFYVENVVFVTSSPRYYHKYDCYDLLNNSNYTTTGLDDAIRKRIQSCPQCGSHQTNFDFLLYITQN